MQVAFVAENVAVLVRHWYEIGTEDDEHGTRVEIRRVTRPEHIGTESAAQPITLDLPLWRADIFDALDEPPGNLARAHFHPTFDGVEPIARHWDETLRSDWRSWLTAQLSDLSTTLADAPVVPDSIQDGAAIAAHLPVIVELAASMLGAQCDAQARCLAATVDTRHALRLMLDQFREPGATDPRLTAAP
jgi:hypothetical protein